MGGRHCAPPGPHPPAPAHTLDQVEDPELTLRSVTKDHEIEGGEVSVYHLKPEEGGGNK